MNKEKASEQTEQLKRPRPIASWFFWGTIGVLALGTVGLQIAAKRQVARPEIAVPQVQEEADPNRLLN